MVLEDGRQVNTVVKMVVMAVLRAASKEELMVGKKERRSNEIGMGKPCRLGQSWAKGKGLMS